MQPVPADRSVRVRALLLHRAAPGVAICFFLVLQLLSAWFWVSSFRPPNRSLDIAVHLVAQGSYACPACNPRLRGTNSGTPFRMFILPGEPLYLAACLRYLPAGLLRYAHVPIVVLLVAAAGHIAQRLSGTLVASMTVIVAILDPFVILHGPVWDDTFLGASCDWAVFALLWSGLDARSGGSATRWRPLMLALIGTLAGYASITRASSQLVLLTVGIAAVLIRQLRPIRIEGLAVVAGIVLALSVWGFRNYRVTGEFAIGSSHDGISLWESVYPSAREALLTLGQTERLNYVRMEDDFARTASLGELEANRYFLRRAVRYILAQPGDVLRTAVVKIGVGLLGLRMEDSLFSARNLIAVVSNALLLAFAAFGAIVMRIDAGPRRVLWRCILAASLLGYIGLSTFGPVGLRYRISLEPVFWILAAGGVVHLAGLWTRRTLRQGPLTEF